MLGLNYISRVLSFLEHRIHEIFNDIFTYIECSTNIIKRHPPLLYECFTTVNQSSHLIFKSDKPISPNFPLFINISPIQASLDQKRIIQSVLNSPLCFKKLFSVLSKKLRLFTDDSKKPKTVLSQVSQLWKITLKRYCFRTSPTKLLSLLAKLWPLLKSLKSAPLAPIITSQPF